MERYSDLMAACKILANAATGEYLAARAFTPAWEILTHASLYIAKQANAAMRGEGAPEIPALLPIAITVQFPNIPEWNKPEAI